MEKSLARKDIVALIEKLVDDNAHCIGHAIAHGLISNRVSGLQGEDKFSTKKYLEDCQYVFDTFRVKEEYSEQMLKLGKQYGLYAYRIMKRAYSKKSIVTEEELGKTSSLLVQILAKNTGAQTHPINTEIAATSEEIGELLFELDESHE